MTAKRRRDNVKCIDPVLCYVCDKYIPHCMAQPIGLGTYRCKTHKQSTILRKGKVNHATDKG
jgi:hypothetical protein